MVDIANVLAPILDIGLTWLSRRRLPKVDGELALPGLQAQVEILRDRWGVPHIYAQNSHDMYMAQGFVHAQDRLWQMEVNRRATAGRLSEVIGPATLQMDRQMRTLTMRRVAESEVALLPDDIREMLDAYAAGVNAFIAQGHMPVEFAILRYKPEPWVIADSLAWVEMMAWTLCADWRSEVRRMRLTERLGVERVAELMPEYLPHWPRVVPSGVPYSVLADVTAEAVRSQTASPQSAASLSATDAGWGSNNWVIGGSRTTTGRPILANDMHLQMSIPAIWYENHLTDGALNVTGVTFPGVPGVVSGHNGHVAWGFTDGFPDVEDLYIEHTRRTEDGRVQVEGEGGWYEATILHEAIRVKGGETVYEDVVVTRHGPVINALLPDWEDAPTLALRWTSLEPDTGMMVAFFRMNRAHTCQGFREALRLWTSPVQNVVYADTEGNIAYSFPGKIPIRARGDGKTPSPGWTDDDEWTGYIPFAHLPHLENPPQGYIASANNQVVDDAYPYDLAVRPLSGNRAQRIVELIESREKIDLAFVRQMHLDVVSPLARTVARYLGQLEVGDPALREVVALVRGWDGAMHADSAAALVYEIFAHQLITMLLAKPLEGHYLFGETTWGWLEKVLAEPHSHWFDLGHGETRDEVMRLALAETLAYLQKEFGPDPADWAWGKLHQIIYNHPLGGSKLLAPCFNRGPYPVSGNGHAVCATHQRNFDSHTFGGPPYRMIVDLGDVRNSVSLLTPGQSGQPGSPHYDDQIAAWSAGEYHPMLFIREDVEHEMQHRLRLL
ncbi:MAG: penicillin acylase family protein [Anaerolineae bacterium]